MPANDPIIPDISDSVSLESRIDNLLSRMSIAEKIGQMSQFNGAAGNLHQAVREGRVGSVINEVDPEAIHHLQRLAAEQSRLGIPLLIGRDVIHGFTTIFPIPLGQAASWNPGNISEGARIAALEASSVGINWTFSPMVDVSRDPRWGRIAECFGEDPYLGSVMAAAMVRGYQGEDLSDDGSIAACAKHFAAYGACESGRDYNTVSMPEIELRNVHLPPFKASIDAGVSTIMTSFSDLNGVPASGNEFLLTQVLRREWDYTGFVVSDWESVSQLTVHGLTGGDKAAACLAANAGLDMEMVSTTYADHLESLIDEGRFSITQLDRAVASILRLKFRMGLFENPYARPETLAPLANEQHLQAARYSATQSCVLLKNDQQRLPLKMAETGSIAIIGPLADEPQEQLGTWVFDGDAQYSQTPLQAIRALVTDQATVHYSRGLDLSRSKSRDGFAAAISAAEQSDVVIVFAGEEAILSGEAHCRADIDLPGYQQQLIEAIRTTGKPIVLVVLAGRPLTLEPVIEQVDAILYAWHPGTMGGPAIADLLFGLEVPSGKLPVTFPRMVGQVPIYYAQKNTGKPASADTFVHIDDIDANAAQTSFGMSAMHLDAGYTPLFEFGYGLSYTHFEYSDILVSSHEVALGETLCVSATLSNTGTYEAEEVVQLYTRDVVASVTRPVRELKGFQKIRLKPGQSITVRFEIHTDELAFYNNTMKSATEPGLIHVWIGGSSAAQLKSEFTITG
jgi:beta-glucosidase